MIITREIEIRINESNFTYFEELGYDISIGDELLIPIELLSKGSHHKIKCQCDGCKIIKDVIYKNYIKYGNEWGIYYCRKCSEPKRKKSLLESHGCEYPVQNKKISKKRKQTMIENHKTNNVCRS